MVWKLEILLLNHIVTLVKNKLTGADKCATCCTTRVICATIGKVGIAHDECSFFKLGVRVLVFHGENGNHGNQNGSACS